MKQFIKHSNFEKLIAQHEKDTNLIARQAIEIIGYKNFLQQLLSIIDSPHAPFVGNLKTNDDITHSYYYALWTAIKEKEAQL
jgi:hypothetical protein